MESLNISSGRILLRDFIEADRDTFIGYQTDPRYSELYDFDQEVARPSKLFDLFLKWQHEQPRTKTQLAICDAKTDRLLGCGGLRKVDHDVAVFGIELAPREWGRFRLALDAASALIWYGFEVLGLDTIIGDTASGNVRVEKLARWFGAELVARRAGPSWMRARGWQEVDWAITKSQWEETRQRLARMR